MRTGARGQRGARGRTGATRLRGPKVTRRDILSALASEFQHMRNQFGDMRKTLDVHLARMSQIQQQLDQIQKLVKTNLS